MSNVNIRRFHTAFVDKRVKTPGFRKVLRAAAPLFGEMPLSAINIPGTYPDVVNSQNDEGM